METALQRWEPSDRSAYAVLRPWKGVFEPTAMESLLTRAVVPKLVLVLRALAIHPG
jgi:tuftelin-interacting protein 11